MRLLVDLQACQSISRLGGIGRYSLDLATAMARHAGGHELRILLSDLLPDSIPGLYRHFAELLPRQQIQVLQLPGPVAESNPANLARARAAELIREACIHRLRPDIVHVASLFEGFLDDVTCSVGELVPGDTTVVTLYDLIPLMAQEQYLATPSTRGHYFRKLESLKRAGGLLAISEFSRRQCMDALDIAPERVVNIAAGVDPKFRPLALPPDRVAGLRDRFGIRDRFALFAGSFDSRKNHARLIQAYARVPQELRDGRQLVIIGNGWQGLYQELRRLGEAAGLAAHELVFTGHVSDEELLDLYNLCELFVFPSLSEGYGLPVLEAMACGIPVIASNTTSIPEVVGRQDALFDPHRVDAIAAKITQALEDAGFRRALAEHGLVQSRHFTWEAVAKRAWDAIEAGHDKTGTAPKPAPSALERDRIEALRGLELGRFGRSRARARIAAALAANDRCLIEPSPTISRIGWITPWDDNCPIAQDAKALIGDRLPECRILAPETAAENALDASNITACWSPRAPNLRDLASSVAAHDLDTLVVHIHDALFLPQPLAGFLREMIATGRRLYLMLHAVREPLPPSLIDSFGLCDGLFARSHQAEAALARYRIEPLAGAGDNRIVTTLWDRLVDRDLADRTEECSSTASRYSGHEAPVS